MATGLRQLAAETGLSIATISRALNKSESVTESTRQKVLEAAARIGYKPNAAARALSTKRTRTIGAVIPTLENSIFSKFINAIEESLAESGYVLILATTDNDPDKEERRATELMDMGAEALIVSGLQHNQSLLQLIQSRGVPVIATSIYDEQSTIPTIGYDNRALGVLAAEYLHKKNHKSIGVIHGPLVNNDRTRLRLAGVRNVYPDESCVISRQCALSVSEAVTAANQLLTSPRRPTAILCLSDVLALGVLFEAPRLGLAIPNDVAVMGFDNLEWAECSSPSLTTIDLPVAKMGRQTAVSLVEHLENASPLLSEKLDSHIIERQSTQR